MPWGLTTMTISHLTVGNSERRRTKRPTPQTPTVDRQTLNLTEPVIVDDTPFPFDSNRRYSTAPIDCIHEFLGSLDSGRKLTGTVRSTMSF